MMSLGAISVLWFTTPAIAAPWMGLYPVLAEPTDPTPIATPESAPTAPVPPASVSPVPEGDRPAEKSPPTAEKTPAPAPANGAKAEAGGPYDMQAIEEFYKSLYGS